MLQLMQDGGNNTAFDAFKFKKIIEENKDLLKIIEDLRFQLATEKNLNQEKFLNVEQQISDVNILNEENNKLQNLKNDLLSQLSAQQQLFDVKVRELQQSEKFFKEENEFMRMKQENMVEGITCLKKYMYESMSDQEKSQNEQKLATLDKTISNLNKNIEVNRNQHKTAIEHFNTQNSEKLAQVTSIIEENLKKISQDVQTGKESKLGYINEIEVLKKEVDSLKKANIELEGNKTQLNILMEQNKLSSQNEEELDASLNVDRVTNALQKSLDLLMVQKE